MVEYPDPRGIIIYKDYIEYKSYPLYAWDITQDPIIIPNVGNEESEPMEANK